MYLSPLLANFQGDLVILGVSLQVSVYCRFSSRSVPQPEVLRLRLLFRILRNEILAPDDGGVGLAAGMEAPFKVVDWEARRGTSGDQNPHPKLAN
jgi:hypothetical protein